MTSAIDPIADDQHLRQNQNMAEAITRSMMFEPLLAADPSFRPRWQAFQTEWADDPDPPLYLALMSLGEHLVGRLTTEQTAGFESVFDVVERWHTDGDAWVSEAATGGLLESLQNLAGGNKRSATFEPWLRPVTRRWWDKLDGFWDGNDHALRLDS